MRSAFCRTGGSKQLAFAQVGSEGGQHALDAKSSGSNTLSSTTLFMARPIPGRPSVGTEDLDLKSHSFTESSSWLLDQKLQVSGLADCILFEFLCCFDQFVSH